MTNPAPYTPTFPTVAELQTLTAQGVFDRVAVHLIRQGARSTVGDSEVCRYRAPSGRACAVGALIPSALYEALWEGSGVSELIRVTEHPELSEFLCKHEALMNDLQMLHDVYPVDLWPCQLVYIAARYELSTAALQAALSPQP